MIKSTCDPRKPKEEVQNTAVEGKTSTKEEVIHAVRPRRAVFGDITNAAQKKAAANRKDAIKKNKQPAETTLKVAKNKPAHTKIKVAAGSQTLTLKKSSTALVKAPVVKGKEEKASQQLNGCSDEGSVPLESNSISDVLVAEMDLSHDDLSHSRMSLDKSIHESNASNQEEMPEVPLDAGVEDIDIGDQDDITLVALYAFDIFKYYKEREELFLLKPYLSQQPHVTQRMRAVLVDWLVEVQENFELNHETLYLAVKLVDTYMSIVPNVSRDIVQLLGSVALFLASKFDERLPPAVDDFLYICDYAYKRDQFLAMERELFCTVGYDLGRPISYRFLRRYARCARSHIKTLYLARYLLELSLMEYKFVFYRESLLAASCLYIARQMQKDGGWTPTLAFYTGYKLEELKPLILELNPLFTNKRNSDLTTIRDKYKHHLFHGVGNVPTVGDEELFHIDTDSLVVKKH